jgi:hypothetical protein
MSNLNYPQIKPLASRAKNPEKMPNKIRLLIGEGPSKIAPPLPYSENFFKKYHPSPTLPYPTLFQTLA